MAEKRISRRCEHRAGVAATRVLTRREQEVLARAREAAGGFDNLMFGAMYVEAIERKVLKDDNSLYQFLLQLDQPPVDIETFLDSDQFLGATDISLWPEVRKAIIEMNRNWWRGVVEGAFHEVVLSGATGTGKTSISQITTLYHMHILGCMKQPQAFYGLPKTTSIVFPIMAAKPHVTRKVVYLPMRKMIEEMPWFAQHLRFNKLIESECYFEEKNIRLVMGGADADSILGEAVIGGILDEINFMNVVLKSKKAEVTSGRAGLYDQAQSIYEAMTRRKKGRFTRPGPMLGIVMVSSSTKYKGDFTDKRNDHVLKHNEKGVYLYNKKQYEVVPSERFSGRTFRLLVGNDILSDTRILGVDEKVPEGSLVLDVPIEYEDDFRKNPHDSLRDIVGMSTNSISPFIRRRFKLYECITAGEEAGLTSFLVKDNVVLGVDGMPQVKPGHYCTNPSRPRYVHIDLSLTGDRCIAAGQRVLMADGRYSAIEHVRVGQSVVSHDGSTQTVMAVHDNGTKPVLSVSVYGWCDMLEATSNHRVLAVRRESITYTNGRLVKPSHSMFRGRARKAAEARYSYVPEFVELGTLRPGDFLVTPRPRQSVHAEIEDTPLTYEAGYIAGVFAAEGSFYMHHGSEYVQFSLHENETHILSQLTQALKVTFGVKVRTIADKRGKGITVRTTKSDALSKFVYAAVGEYSDRKHMGAWRFGNPVFHAGMAHGYVDGDGCVRYDTDGAPIAFTVKTVSRPMAESFYWLLTASGYVPGLQKVEGYTSTHHGVESVHKPCYSVVLSGKSQMEKFASWGDGTLDVPCSQAISMPEYVLSPIQDIVDGGESRVYDLTVSNTSSYTVGASAVHNCGIAMLRFDGMQSVEREGGMIEQLPSCSVELACTIEPDAQSEIQIAEVRMWVKHLRDAYGYPIKVVTYDGYNSRESVQQWRKDGVKTGHVSVDRTSTPYKQLRDAINDARLKLFHNDVMLSEFFDLEYDEHKDRVDHPVNGCFVGGTRLRLPDGRSITFAEAAAYESIPVWTYAEGESSVALGVRPRVTKHVTELVELVLENGAKIQCTPDHRFLLRDGTYKAAGLLTPEDDLQD